MTTTPIDRTLERYRTALAEPDKALRDSYDHARVITRERAKNFYYGLRLTPEPRRSALYALYAWMRTGDDIVDDAPPAERRDLFEAFASQSERVIDGGDARGPEPWWPAFSDACKRWSLPASQLRAMLDGLRQDLAPSPFVTEADVDRYCRHVGSSVGVLCVGIWGLRPGADPDRARDLAEERGIAFQRTNILRDIAEDARRQGRSYVASETLDHHGLTRGDLEAWSKPERCRAVVGALAAEARHRYEASQGLEAMITPECVPVLRAMTDIYSGVLRCLEKSPDRAVVGPRARVTKRRKLAIAATALVGSAIPAWQRR